MICNVCGRKITGPSVLLYVVLARRQRQRERSRYTGIAWHPACAPLEREHLCSEAAALGRGQADPLPREEARV